jgi:hypothetical protein
VRCVSTIVRRERRYCASGRSSLRAATATDSAAKLRLHNFNDGYLNSAFGFVVLAVGLARAPRRRHNVGRAGAYFGEVNAAVETANRQTVKIHVNPSLTVRRQISATISEIP